MQLQLKQRRPSNTFMYLRGDYARKCRGEWAIKPDKSRDHHWEDSPKKGKNSRMLIRDAMTLCVNADNLDSTKHVTVVWTNVDMGTGPTSTVAIFSFQFQLDKTESLVEDILSESVEIERSFVRPAMACFEESRAIAKQQRSQQCQTF